MIRHTRESFYCLIRRLFITALYMTLGAALLYSPRWWFVSFEKGRVLNVCTFTETFSYEAIEKFQQETGIKVNMTYVEIDAQTYAKFCVNQCRDYDVMNLSDTYVHRVGNMGYLADIDWGKIPNAQKIYPMLRHRTYDPEDRYCVPNKWYVYGLVYDKHFFNIDPDDISWDLIFKNPETFYQEGIVPAPYRACMIDDARDAALVAGMYLYGDIHGFDQYDLSNVQDILLQQKKWIEAYTLYSAQYFLYCNIVPIAAMTSNYMRRLYASSNRYEFAIPKEGSIMIIENMVIPKCSKNIDLAHTFIDFMLRDDIARLNAKTYTYNSSNEFANDYSEPGVLENRHMFPDADMLRRLRVPFLESDMHLHIEKCWLSVGFA